MPGLATEIVDLVRLANTHRVMGSLWHGLLTFQLADSVPDDLALYLEAIQELNERRNRRIANQCVQLSSVLNAVDITPLFLKGTAQYLSGLYAHPAQRFIGDIDLLVEEADLPRAKDRLVAAGYREHVDASVQPDQPLALVHRSQPAMVEVRAAALPAPLAELLPARELLDRAVALDGLDGCRALSPAPRDLVVHNALHALHKHRSWRHVHLPLRDGLDLILLARRYRNQLDWPDILRCLARGPGGRAPFAFYVNSLADIFPSAALPVHQGGLRERLAVACVTASGRWSASPALRAAARILACSDDVLWRVHRSPDERRRLLARAASPSEYSPLMRRFHRFVRSECRVAPVAGALRRAPGPAEEKGDALAGS